MEYKNLEEVLRVINSNQLVMLVASTKNCGVCTAIKPRIKQLLENHPKAKEIPIFIDSLVETSGKFMVFTVPTIILFAKGKEVHRESRIIDFGRLGFELARWNEFLFDH